VSQLKVAHSCFQSCKCHAEYSSCLAAVSNEVLVSSPGVGWADIAGLEATKQVLQEAVVLPSIRPDIFTGLRAPSKGVCSAKSTCMLQLGMKGYVAVKFHASSCEMGP
jgi:SpoVK/Ycf46/Vps4 family AAA+-type ATPase